ncbi:MAG: SCP2 sterol-binding domain-containing protein [Actinomycetota bacterium]|nr:SCP2 sterol-binding domain-containing protein [Actinomycetota bacterium]
MPPSRSNEPDAREPVPFLTGAWVEAFDQQLQRLGVVGDDAEASVVEYVVDGSEIGAYHVVIEPASVRVLPGAATSPDVRLTQDLTTAEAVASGERSALDAFMGGDIVLTGDADRLRGLTEVMTRIGEASSAIGPLG